MVVETTACQSSRVFLRQCIIYCKIDGSLSDYTDICSKNRLMSTHVHMDSQKTYQMM